MKELLVIAFNEAYDKLCSSVPKTKEIQKVLNIDNLSLLQLNNKINDLGISADRVVFSTKTEYTTLSNYEKPVILYNVICDTTETEQLEYKHNKMKLFADKCVYDILMHYEYKQIWPNYNKLEQLGLYKADLYDLYINNDWNKICAYYSCFYVKI